MQQQAGWVTWVKDYATAAPAVSSLKQQLVDIERCVWRLQITLKDFAAQIGAMGNPGPEEILSLVNALESMAIERKGLSNRLSMLEKHDDYTAR